MISVRVIRFGHERGTRFDTHWLSETDRVRLSRMRSAASRERFLFTRKMLYQVLSEETGLDPSALQVDVGYYGKPYLASHPQCIHFSLSHCREFLAIATSFDGDVGVDIEDSPLCGPAPSLAAVCSAGELQSLATVPEVDFLALWTRKEAFLKLNGVGLSVDPKEVEIAQGRFVRYSGASSLLYRCADVSLHKADQGYVLAVACPLSRPADIAIAFMDDDFLLER